MFFVFLSVWETSGEYEWVVFGHHLNSLILELLFYLRHFQIHQCHSLTWILPRACPPPLFAKLAKQFALLATALLRASIHVHRNVLETLHPQRRHKSVRFPWLLLLLLLLLLAVV
jgi:hypothetical protein